MDIISYEWFLTIFILNLLIYYKFQLIILFSFFQFIYVHPIINSYCEDFGERNEEEKKGQLFWGKVFYSSKKKKPRVSYIRTIFFPLFDITNYYFLYIYLLCITKL